MQIVCSEVRFCEKSRVKRSFWKLGVSLLGKVSWKMLVLEGWIVTFGETRGICSFWKLGLSLLMEVSWKMLVLKAWIVALGEISWCAAGVSSKSFAQECQGRVSRKERQERVSSKSVLSRVSSKIV